MNFTSDYKEKASSSLNYVFEKIKQLFFFL